jgi:ribosomal protein S18 acetylase RimI-like enzyme
LLFRPIGDDDLPFLSALYASTREGELAASGWPDAAKRDFLAQQFAAQHTHYMRHYPGAEWLIAETGGRAVGRLYFVRWPRDVRIIDIALMPAARNHGYGTAMLGDLIDEAGAERKAVSIHVERRNPALALYRRLRFEIAEDKGVYLLLQRQVNTAS